jgi:uncharacterized protein YacL
MIGFSFANFLSDLVNTHPSAPESNAKVAIILILAISLLVFFFLFPTLRKKVAHKALKKVMARSRGGLLGFSLTILLLTWFRLETIPFFSMRLWLVVTLLLLLGWIFWKIFLFQKIDKRIKRAEKRRKKKN